MRRLFAGSVGLMLFALGTACGSSTPGTTSPTSSSEVDSASTASSSSTPPVAAPNASASAAPSAPKLALNAGWGIVATAPVGKSFTVLPSSDGTALVAIHSSKNREPPYQWARVAGKTAELSPAITKKLPEFGFDGTGPNSLMEPAFDARSKDNAVLSFVVNGDKGPICVVHAWKDSAWTKIGETKPDEGPCQKIRAWTPGAAVAILSGKNGDTFTTFGKLAGPTPVLAKVGKKACELTPHDLGAWETGELVVHGVNCEPDRYIEGWAPKAAKPVTSQLALDYNAPIASNFLAGGEIALEGGGILPENPNEETSVKLTLKFDGKKFSKVSMAAGANVKEVLMIGGEAARSLATSDETLELESSAVAGDDIYLVVTREGGGAVLLRSAPVDAPLALR